jgi:hypothetical protein
MGGIAGDQQGTCEQRGCELFSQYVVHSVGQTSGMRLRSY